MEAPQGIHRTQAQNLLYGGETDLAPGSVQVLMWNRGKTLCWGRIQQKVHSEVILKGSRCRLFLDELGTQKVLEKRNHRVELCVSPLHEKAKGLAEREALA